MQCAGAFITAPWGGGDVVGLAHDIPLPDDLRFGVVTSPAEVRDRVRRLLIGGADLIKCIGTGAVLTRGGVPAAPELSEDELRAAVEEAAHYGKFVAVHAHSDEGAMRAVRAGARSVEHGSMLDRGRDPDDRGRRHVPVRRHLRRRVGAGARRRGALARRHDAQAAPRRWTRGGGVPAGGRARRPDHVRDGQRRVSPRARREGARRVRALGHDADRGDPRRDDGGRGMHGLGRPRRARSRRGGSRTSSRWTGDPLGDIRAARDAGGRAKGGRVVVDRRAS